MREPIWVYDNWSAYTDQHGGGVSPLDRVRLTEDLAMRELREVVRLKTLGVHFDYYMMNAFWFAPDGAYRQWRQPDWPDGPDRWIEGCQQNGLKPGLWFGTNALSKKIHAVLRWHDSVDPKRDGESAWMSLFEGEFLADFMEALQHWYDRGVRMFELDFANFDAATPAGRKTFSLEEIRERNQTALRTALHAFRRKNPDAMLAAFNDFGGDVFQPTSTPFPSKNPVDLRWLEVFDTLYCGDVHVSDVPQVSFWRAVDLYCDHMVRRYEQSGVPLERIDTFSTFSTTWFGYNRQLSAWKGMLLLTAARGGWKNTVYGSIELLGEEHAHWFAKLQKIYAPLQAMGRTKTFGGIPGEEQPYGFCSFDSSGALYTVVNPAQEVRTIDLPLMSRIQQSGNSGRVLFRDAGYISTLTHRNLTLGPGQMAAVGFGRYAEPEFDLGVQEDVIIPRLIAPVKADFRNVAPNMFEATFEAPSRADLRILMEQRSPNGATHKTYGGGAGPKPQDVTKLLQIEVSQGGKPLPIEREQKGKDNLFGISWGAGEVRAKHLKGGRAVTVRCSSAEKQPVHLEVRIYAVEY